jgi:ATP-dependent Zn protease
MTPGFTGAEIENLVNTAITEAVHKGKICAE